MNFRKSRFGLGDEYDGLPSSDLLYTPAGVAASAPGPSTVGTGPATLPATAPVPLTEDEIAEAYGGNPTFGSKVAAAAKANPLLVGGAMLSIAFIAWSMSRGK